PARWAGFSVPAISGAGPASRRSWSTRGRRRRSRGRSASAGIKWLRTGRDERRLASILDHTVLLHRCISATENVVFGRYVKCPRDRHASVSPPGSAASMDGAGGAKLWGWVFEIHGG